MGNGVFYSYVKERGYEETHEVPSTIKQNEMLAEVENFILCATNSSDQIEGVWLLLTSYFGRKHFRSYLVEEGIDEVLSFFQDLSAVKASRSRIPSEDNIYQRDITHVCTKYFNSSRMIRNILRGKLYYKENMLDECLSPDQCDIFVMKVLDELVRLFAQHAFNPFMRSNHYSKWRAVERSHAIAVKLEDSKQLKRLNSEFTYRDSLPQLLQKKIKSICTPTDLAFTAIAGMYESCATRIIDFNCGWLLSLLSASEVLPVSLFMCATNNFNPSDNSTRCSSLNSKKLVKVGLEDLDFPLLFVNKHFQTLNQIRASSVLGESIIDILWGDGLNSVETYQNLFGGKKSMSESNVEEIKLRNRDGNEVKNFIGIKPIYNSLGELCYFIGLQLKSGEGYQLSHDPKNLLYTWLGKLPGIIIVEDD